MSDKIINAIKLLVEDGAEVTYARNSQQPTDYYQGVTAGRLTERQRIIQLVKGELPLVVQERFIQLINEGQND